MNYDIMKWIIYYNSIKHFDKTSDEWVKYQNQITDEYYNLCKNNKNYCGCNINYFICEDCRYTIELLQLECNVYYKNAHGIFSNIKNKKIGLVKYMIENNLINKNYSDPKTRQSLLINACKYNKTEIAVYLIYKDCDVNIYEHKHSRVKTSVDFAIFNNNYGLVCLLREHNAKTGLEILEDLEDLEDLYDDNTNNTNNTNNSNNTNNTNNTNNNESDSEYDTNSDSD
jgi:hypothetical protein